MAQRLLEQAAVTQSPLQEGTAVLQGETGTCQAGPRVGEREGLCGWIHGGNSKERGRSGFTGQRQDRWLWKPYNNNPNVD